MARRLYNIFRLTGRYSEAAYLRELFDEPTTVLYQIAALVRTLDEADRPGADFDTEMLVAQADTLIMSAIAALDGPRGGRHGPQPDRGARRTCWRAAARLAAAADVVRVKDEALRSVNEYFERRLREVPSIAEYLEALLGTAKPG